MFNDLDTNDNRVFSVIGFRFYRICRFYRITKITKKNPEMLPPLGSETLAPDF